MKEHIVKLLLSGNTYNQIRGVTGAAKSTIAYHAKQLGLQKSERKTIDWEDMQRIYDERKLCLVELSLETGVAKGTISAAVKSGKLVVNRSRLCRNTNRVPNDHIFVENSTYDIGMVKGRIKRDNLLPYRCHNHACPLHDNHKPLTWCGEPIVLHIDHINGRSMDHRLDNLRWLCPNCHSQTPTYCGRNARKL